MNGGNFLWLFPIRMANKHLNCEGSILLLFAQDVDGIPHLLFFSASDALTYAHR